jgi:hypothetical protein
MRLPLNKLLLFVDRRNMQHRLVAHWDQKWKIRLPNSDVYLVEDENFPLAIEKIIEYYGEENSTYFDLVSVITY